MVSEKNKTFIIAILTGFIVGSMGFAIIRTATTSASIGELKGPEDITIGTWFRYDIVPVTVKNFDGIGWYKSGGLPYLIVECTNITTWREINDTRHQQGNLDNVAFDWKITPYWSNGAEATELINGSIENTFWKYLFKPIYDGFNQGLDTGLAKVARPYIDTTFQEWSYTKVHKVSELGVSYYQSSVGAIQGITGVTLYYSPYVNDISAPGLNVTSKDLSCYYEIDTGILYFYKVVDAVFSTGGGYHQYVFMTGFGNETTAFGKKPPTPSPVTGNFVKTQNASYEYDLLLYGNYNTALVNIESNDTNGFPNIINMMVTGSTIPIDISASVSLNVSIVGIRAGLSSEPYNFSSVLDLINPAGKIDNVTLLSADRIGNSILLNWTANPDASQYRVMLNDTMFGEPTTDTKAYIAPPVGIWNISIICDSFLYNESSNPSNGILVNYTIPENETAPSEKDYATNPDDLGITTVDHTTETIIIIVVILAIGAVIAFVVARPYLTGQKKTNLPSVSSPSSKTRDGSRCLL